MVAPRFLSTSNARTPLLLCVPKLLGITRSTSAITLALNFRPANCLASGYRRHHAESLATNTSAHGANVYVLPTTATLLPLTRSASPADMLGPGAKQYHCIK